MGECSDDEPWGQSPCQGLMQGPGRTRESVKCRIITNRKQGGDQHGQILERSSRILMLISIGTQEPVKCLIITNKWRLIRFPN